MNKNANNAGNMLKMDAAYTLEPRSGLEDDLDDCLLCILLPQLSLTWPVDRCQDTGLSGEH